MPIDPAAVMWSTPERERAGRPLLVLLHGYGGHEGDLFSLSPYLPLDLTIASVRAPQRQGAGHSWYTLELETLHEEGRRLDAATDGLLQWLAGARVGATSVGLLGFSQGGAVATHALRRDPASADYVVNLAGWTIAGEQPGDATLAERGVPVFWGRGLRDQVIPAAEIARTEAWLPEHSDLTRGVYEQLDHSVSQAELSDVVRFLRARLA